MDDGLQLLNQNLSFAFSYTHTLAHNAVQKNPLPLISPHPQLLGARLNK